MTTVAELAAHVEELHADFVQVEALARAACDSLEAVPSVQRNPTGRRAQDRLHVLVTLAARDAEALLQRCEQVVGALPKLIASDARPLRGRRP